MAEIAVLIKPKASGYAQLKGNHICRCSRKSGIAKADTSKGITLTHTRTADLTLQSAVWWKETRQMPSTVALGRKPIQKKWWFTFQPCVTKKGWQPQSQPKQTPKASESAKVQNSKAHAPPWQRTTAKHKEKPHSLIHSFNFINSKWSKNNKLLEN